MVCFVDGCFSFWSEIAVKAKYMKEHFTNKILVLIHIIFKEATPDRLNLILQVLYIHLEKLCLEKCEIIHESVTTYISPYTET